MQRISLCPAFVLHCRAYRETSLIVELLTQDWGRVAVVARGARGKKSKLRALLQPCRKVVVSWQGRQELKTATDFEACGVVMQPQGQALFCALYANELLTRLLQALDPCPELFSLYELLLRKLSILGRDEMAALEPLLRDFEMSLLELLGYALPLEADAQGEVLQASSWYHYASAQGFTPTALEVEEGELAGQQNIFYGEHLQRLAQGDLTQVLVRRAAKRLLRQALASLLGNRALVSRELFRPMPKESIRDSNK